MRNRARRTSVVFASVVVSLAVAACGVPSTDGAEALPTDVAAIAQLPPVVESSAPRTSPVVVTLVGNDKLVRTRRLVVGQGRKELLNAALAGVVTGPDSTERAAGLITLVHPDATLTGVLSRHAASVNLEFGQAPPVELSLAVGQVALTALGIEGVRKVAFRVDGSRVRVPMPDGGPDQRWVTARDYRDVVKRPR